MKKNHVIILFFLFLMASLFFCQRISAQTIYPNYWSSNREYTYLALYIDSTGETISTEKVILHPTGEVWEMDSRQTLMDYTLDSITADWNRMPKVPLNGKARHWWTSTYQEGVLQNENKIWMHPVRQNQYLLTEVAPFPKVLFPVMKDSLWMDTLYIYETMGLFEGTVISTYKVEEKELRSYPFGNKMCWKIVATAQHDKLGKSSAVFYFDEAFGFTEMNYIFYNKQKIEFKLIGLKQ